MKRKMKFDYDHENDSLFLYDPSVKSNASVEIDDMIIDYTSKKEVSAIELLNASVFFKDISSEKDFLTKQTLQNIADCTVEIIPKQNFFMIKFIFTLQSKKRLCAPVMVPSIQEPSPAVASII